MNRSLTVFLFAAVSLSCGFAWAQNKMKTPQIVGPGFMDSQKATLRYARTNKMTNDGKAAIQQQRLRSVPNWSSSFTFKGTPFPYTMVGGDPRKGDTTRVDTALISISFFFDEFADANGNNIVIDAAPVIPLVLNSPNFENAGYGTGFTQFGDAVQRAEFFNVMKDEWHTGINKPRMLTPVQIEVPFGAAFLFQLQSGAIFALIDFNFFVSQLNTIVQLEPMNVNELTIALTRNAAFYQGNLGNCCVIGFHTAFETAVQGNTHFVQTFATASWLDPGFFSNPDVVDVLPLSHEISEWLDDPFVNNLTPPWQFPDGSGVCQNNLETGDPVEVLPHPAFPITVDGFTYHPQTEALLQWFTRESPSSAFQHAYSYPDVHALPTASKACTTP
ncbi:MAG: hypothetical protein M3O35_09975 [Acidobacteriota bacterium]|nr:hypothetical protein [Acidobacteriota bacterium]